MHPDFAHQLCPTLETPRLLLQPRMGSHADAALGLLQDDAIYQWISMDKPPSLDWLRQRWTRTESRLSPDGTEAWPIWAIVWRRDGALVGQVDATVDGDRVCTNFGYYLHPSFWNQGLATEAVKATADHLLGSGVTRLIATVTVGNHASAKVLKKTGFVFGRTIPGSDTIRGVLCDDEEYVRSV